MTATASVNKPLIVFDVNETLLDLETMTPIFERLFGDRHAMRTWFDNLIVYSEALTLANTYVPFTEIGAAVLQMLANARGTTISDADKRDLTDNFASMPPHPEVPAALAQLREAGFRLFTLTDNLLEIQGRQLEHGGIIGNFERRFSVDQEVRRHKPAPEAYGYVRRQLGAKPSEPGGMRRSSSDRQTKCSLLGRSPKSAGRTWVMLPRRSSHDTGQRAEQQIFHSDVRLKRR